MLPLERSVHAESKSPLHQPPQLSCETAERYIYCSKLQISVNRQGIILSECKENRCGLCKRNRQVPLQRSLEFFLIAVLEATGASLREQKSEHSERVGGLFVVLKNTNQMKLRKNVYFDFFFKRWVFCAPKLHLGCGSTP